MKDLVLVTKRGPLQKLVHETPDGVGVKRATIAILVHVLLQILFAVLENENEFRLGVYNVVEADDVDMLELLHERDLSDGGRWSSFFSIEMNFLECYNLIGGSRSTLCKVIIYGTNRQSGVIPCILWRKCLLLWYVSAAK